MKLELYAVYDQKTRTFDAPFTAQNEQTAVRTFSRVLSSIPLMKDHPSDFDLYRVGTYHSTTGRVDPDDVVQKIINGYAGEDDQQGNENDVSQQSTPQVGDETPVQPSS